MSDLLWQKPGVTVDADIQAFLAGDDVILDREFFLHDIAASRAHAEGLQRIGILSADELAGIGRDGVITAPVGRTAANAAYRYAPPFIAVIGRGLDVSVAELGVALAITDACGLASPLIGRLVARPVTSPAARASPCHKSR